MPRELAPAGDARVPPHFHLVRDFTLVYIDRPSNGHSGPPPEPISRVNSPSDVPVSLSGGFAVNVLSAGMSSRVLCRNVPLTAKSTAVYHVIGVVFFFAFFFLRDPSAVGKMQEARDAATTSDSGVYSDLRIV